VRLRGINNAGCFVDTVQQIQVQANIVKIPNIFTPGGSEGLNDNFEIPGVEYGFWKLVVYNRYGTVVHEENNYKSTWRADNVTAGVYYYTLQNRLRPEKFFKGYISIVKGTASN
jgi:gliding motility-associated-like protein